MKIQSLQYEDLSTGWKLDLIEFNPQLTLLVGVSGVGKTQILTALQNLMLVANGSYDITEKKNNIKWEIKFITNTDHNCTWIGAFEKNKKENHFSIEYEKLFIDTQPIISRDKNGVVFDNNKPIKLSQEKSVIYLLQAEDKIEDTYISFHNIFNNKENDFWAGSEKNTIKYELETFVTLQNIRNSSQDIRKKIFFLYKNQNILFKEMERIFIDIFPSIEKIDIKLDEDEDEVYFRPCIQIKEKNVNEWIEDYKISSGMWKTLMHIAELYLCPDNSVILIDEFENSLGINCIDEVVYQMLASERDLQFIITSHHPYIINKIGYEYWKIVTRKGSTVKCIDAKEFGIGKSKHQAFIQLANLTEYSEGIES